MSEPDYYTPDVDLSLKPRSEFWCMCGSHRLDHGQSYNNHAFVGVPEGEFDPTRTLPDDTETLST